MKIKHWQLKTESTKILRFYTTGFANAKSHQKRHVKRFCDLIVSIIK